MNKSKNKRDNSVLSPIDATQSKLSRDDVSFAFIFNDYFGIDFESFVGLSKQEQIENFQSHFSRLRDEAETPNCEINRLTNQIQLLTTKLTQIFENSRWTDKSETVAQQTAVALCNKPSIISLLLTRTLKPIPIRNHMQP